MNTKNFKHKKRGFSLLEVLVAVVIVVFGLLGLASLQTHALRYQKSSHFRSAVSLHFSNLAERMRTNLSAVASGAYLSHDQYTANYRSISIECSACTAQQIASRDLNAWRLDLAKNLPGGWGEVKRVRGGEIKIRIYYQDPLDSSLQVGYFCKDDSFVAKNWKAVRCFEMGLQI